MSCIGAREWAAKYLGDDECRLTPQELTNLATMLDKYAARGKTHGVALIAAERERQITQEGWTPEHDDEHDDAAMAEAAICYALQSVNQITWNYSVLWAADESPIEGTWPWSEEWWKPTVDPIRNLVKAGALIAAEIDRLQRRAK